MKKSFSFLAAAVLFFSSAGCQEQKSKDSNKLGGQADLKLACVTKFLRSDGSWYFTEQKHEIFIGPKAITLTTKEPFGEIVLTVRNGQFVIKKSPQTRVFDEELFKLMTDEAVCRALLELYLAELKSPPTSTGQTGSLMFEGQVYTSVYCDQSGVEVYKNKSTRRNDLVISQGKKKYVLYGYNYLKRDKAGHFPSKIDIYVYNSGSDRKLVAQYNCRLL
jgi:hypothetical protein